MYDGAVDDAPGTPYEPPRDLAAPIKRGFRPAWLAWGCGGLLAVTLLLMGSCFVLYKQGMAAGERDFGPPCERYLVKVQAGDFQGAYAGLSDALRQRIKEDDLMAIERATQRTLGPLRSKTVSGVQAGATTSTGALGRIWYRGEFEKGAATIRFELRKEHGEWKISGLGYDSPLLEHMVLDALKEAGAQP